jgi:hypothetical protein
MKLADHLLLLLGLLALAIGIAVGGVLLHRSALFLGVLGGVVMLAVLFEGAYRTWDEADKRAEAHEAQEFSIGPSPFPRTELERAVVESKIAFEEIEREMTVRGQDGLLDRLIRCAGDVDLRLREADAGDLYARFREDGLHPPHGADEQIAYLKRQVVLFESTLRELRRDGG